MTHLSHQQLQTSPEYGQGMNPISRLAQIQQAKKEKEPDYSMVTERGLPRRREFVMQVSRQHLRHAGSLTSLCFSLCLCLLTAQLSIFVPHVFLVQVTVCGQSAEGMGPSKKVAKRNAAEKMLELLGYKVPQPQPPKPALKTDEKVLLRLHQTSLVFISVLNHHSLMLVFCFCNI